MPQKKKKREKGKHGKIVAAVPLAFRLHLDVSFPKYQQPRVHLASRSPRCRVQYLEFDENDTSDTTPTPKDLTETQVVKEPRKAKQPELLLVQKDERNLEGTSKGEKRPPLLVKEVLVWRDLEHAWVE